MDNYIKSVLNDLRMRITQARIAAGWTQKEMSTRSGVSYKTLTRFEQGGDIKLSHVIKLAAALGELKPFEQLFAIPEDIPLDEYKKRLNKKRAR